MSSKNQYEKRARKKSLLGAITETQETKGDVKNSLIEMGKDLIVGVIGGGVVGAAIGKASLVIGAAVTTAGHYAKNRLASIFGVGMMAANGFQTKKENVSGTEEETDMLEGAKERVLAFKDTFSEKLFLDKILRKKAGDSATSQSAATEKSTAGMGDVQYFTYPDQGTGSLGEGEIDMSALDRIEQQVAQSAAAFRKNQEEVKGILPSDQDVGEMGEEPDVEDQNF